MRFAGQGVEINMDTALQGDVNALAWQTLQQGRLHRAFGFMRQADLDILIVASTDSMRSRGNVRFLTNYATWSDSSLAILVQGGQPVLLVPAGAFQFGWAKRMAWVTDIRAVNDFAIASLDVLHEFGRRQAVVGLAGFENLPGSIASHLKSSLPDLQIQNVTDAFLRMRSVKTTDEIGMARRSVELADDVLEALPSLMRVGTAESELFARAVYLLAARGAEDTFIMASAEPKTVMPIPAARRLQEHDTIRFSVEPTSPGGFWTQTIRAFSLGRPGSETQNAFDLCLEALEKARESLRPGHRGGDIARAMTAVLGRAKAGHIGPLGHGIGLDLTEPPFVRADDDNRLEPGMVIAIHPQLTWGEVDMWVGDTFLVTEEGPVRLSRTSPDLMVL
jgi:Xaa-Pro dipeptidase